MSAYQIHYLNDLCALSCLFVVRCSSDERATETALALPKKDYRALEIWRGDTLVFKQSATIH